MKISIEGIVLAKGTAACEDPIDLKINGFKELQISSLLRAKEVMVFDRGNSKITISFSTSRQHHSADDALIHSLSLTDAVTSIHGTTTFEIEDNRNSVFHLTNSSVKQISSHTNGVTSHHSYQLIGSKIEN